MNFKPLALAIPLFTSAHALATILPPNQLHLQDNLNFNANIDEPQFLNIINRIVDLYKPIVASHGATLESNNLWTDPTVNASAQQTGSTWIINMYGGLARRPEVTPDGFALVVCHELGHHLGGFAFYGNADWAASEGQSDYFATQACARKIWKSEKSVNARFRATVGSVEKEKCDASWNTEEDQNLCYRTSAGGSSLANLLAALNSEPVPQFDTPDLRQVKTTDVAHPKGQCRLDTYFQGALCKVPFNDNLIPARNLQAGQTSVAAETLASETSCMLASGQLQGNRPRCWYGPVLSFLGIKAQQYTAVESSGNGNSVLEPGETGLISYTLSNGTERPTTGISLKVESKSKDITFTKFQVDVPDIPAKQTRSQENPFELTLNREMKCGSKIPLQYTATSDQGSVAWQEEMVVGKLVEKDIGTLSPEITIPDRNKTGIVSTLASKNQSIVTRADVDIAITHTYPSDLKLSLITPSGLSTNLEIEESALTKIQRAQGKLAGKLWALSTGVGIYQVFKVALPGVESLGDWKLHVRDEVAGDIGTLDKWSLKLTSAVCQP